MDSDNEIEKKNCTKCGEEKELTKFSILSQKNGKITYNSQCKECRNLANK